MTRAKGPAPFTAVDGEAIDGTYSLLMASTGAKEFSLEGLATARCLEFLLRLPKPAVNVCFGLNYDVNQWLKDLPRRDLEYLHENNKVYWRDYRIEWVQGRWFSVKDLLNGRYARVNEVFGFFQSRFVSALDAWGIEVPDEMELMKRRRGTFTAADRRRTEDYCASECAALVDLMGRLRAACESAGYVPRQWIGAGAMAAAALGAHDMEPHHAYDLDLASDQVVEDAVLGAYFGGRVEMLAQGVFENVRTVDIRSAYPAAIQHLPSLAGATLKRVRRYDPDAQHAIWRVSWDCTGWPIAPFPARRQVSIHYPSAGTGHYHAAEVRQALALGYPIEIHEGWVLKCGPDRPFEWIGEIYKSRARLKAAGDPAEKAIKLAMNSVYGKLAQGYGYKGRPKWQNYFWAGEVTAACRARVLAAAHACREPIMISTDGVFGRGVKIRGTKKPDLGSWEPGRLDSLFVAQPGVYRGQDGDHEVTKSRGFFAREIDYRELQQVYERHGPDGAYRYQSTRFVGLGAALMRSDFGLWRQWETAPRTIQLMPRRKELERGGGMVKLTPLRTFIESEPYTPKQSLIDARAIDFAQGMESPNMEAAQ